MCSLIKSVEMFSPSLFWCLRKRVSSSYITFPIRILGWSCHQVNTFKEKQKEGRAQPCPYIELTPTLGLPRSKAAVGLVQDYAMGGCKVMDLLQENWGVDHTHDSEKRKEDLCVQGNWVRLE